MRASACLQLQHFFKSDSSGCRSFLELSERLLLYLPDPLSCNPECFADTVKGARLLAIQPEPQLNNLALDLTKLIKPFIDMFTPAEVVRCTHGRHCILVFQNALQRVFLVISDEHIQGIGFPKHLR